ncbi:histidinol dehydrogenase [Corynebacterium epidermidicanis]|uniref:Histidinol dehydrogenase n=1 Tax=Corynebacterium epidermidicanis TaxID=1050174 RepID=A0A0G3GQQ9_9CORY|nr:histidinol dehydrogenase [Corynebacterium epidermidicanis]AKK03474.1 histidinol dehydrogenase [Corynebacterium epidermidicanis]
MLNIIDMRGQEATYAHLRRTLPRGQVDITSTQELVAPIVADIRQRGAAAALEYGEKFDHVRPSALKVPQEVVDKALADLKPEVEAALKAAISRVRTVHAAQKPQATSVKLADGAVVREEFLPVKRVGLYVPGGNAVYPSSVIMNVVPAQEAGVEKLVVASPPQADCGGWPHPTILAACALLGVDEVWAVGGAQAVALLAYGDDEADCEPVDMITGPGNVFVTAAKRLVRGVVGIDAEAGPTEIAIIADDTANPVFVAYDLISQAEHDVMAASVLITDSPDLAEAVNREIAARFSVTLNADRVAEALTGQQSGIVLVDSLSQAIDVANAYAAEHLEIHTANANAVAAQIHNAGAVFVGEHAPVPLGDYAAGSNHVLPTSGSAAYAAGLSTHTFLKPVHFIEYDAQALADIAEAVITLADEERLPAHGEAIKARLENR